MPPLLRNGSGKLMKGGRSKTPVNSSWHKNDRPVTIPPSVRPKEILFREHEIPVPLKTQGWIINSLHSIRYDPQIGEWNYRYFKGSRNSTKMFDLLSKLSAAIQTRQQFEEHGASPPDSSVLDCEEEQDMEL